MPTPITLPKCLLEAYSLLFPGIDFTRVHFFQGIPGIVDTGQGGITLTSIPSDFNVYVRYYNPCDFFTFRDIAHELVHVFQGQKGFLGGHANAWILNYVTATLATLSSTEPNPYEAEAYAFGQRLWESGVTPCVCGNGAPWITANPNFQQEVLAHHLVRNDPPNTDPLASILDRYGGWASLVVVLWIPFAIMTAIIATILVDIIDLVTSAVQAIKGFFLGGGGAGSLSLAFSRDDGLTFDDELSVDSSSEQPAVSFGTDRLFISWTGTDDHLKAFAPPTPTKSTLVEVDDDAGPALAFGNGQLYVAWQDTDNALNLMSSQGGINFKNQVTLSETSPDSAAPGLACGNGRVYLAWIGQDNHLNVASSADGQSWSGKITLDETSGNDGTAALAFGNGRLFLAWAGTDDSNSLNVMSFDVSADGQLQPLSKVTLSEQSSDDAGPALAFGNSRLFLAWTGTDDRVNVMSSLDGVNFENKQTLSLSSDNAGPALAYGLGTLCLAWIAP